MLLSLLKYCLFIFLTCLFLFACKEDDEVIIDPQPEDNKEVVTDFYGIPTLKANYSYGNVAVGGGGFVSGIITSPFEKYLIYIRTDTGGAYRWIESTQSWKSLLDFVSSDETSILGIQSIAIDPANPSKVYMAAGLEYLNGGLSYILISNNYGESFDKINVTSKFTFHGNCMERQNSKRPIVDPNSFNILCF
ncbi:MAG: hypothetical protein JW842_11490 [Prolixibacteraceae bacterium]|nr:hypothetical protein [Prolixibacteraceae bacterium]